MLANAVSCGFCRVKSEMPTVEVRFENLNIEAETYAETGRNLPTILNTYRSVLEVTVA